MELTNIHNLPDTIVRFAQNDTYNAGASNITVTGLIDSPRIACLRKKHWGEMTEDVSEKLWALMGTALHHVLEHTDSKTTIAEERLFVTRNGWVISGQIDAQIIDGDTVVVGDYKFTSVWAVMNAKPEWEKQLNMYAWLVEQTSKRRVTKLQVFAMCRDWSRRNVGKDGYPVAPLVVVDVPMWTAEERERYALERLELHANADVDATLGEITVRCSNEEKWARGETYAVKKPALKRAMRVFDNRAEADVFSASSSATIVEVRPATPTRCVNNFCRVNQWCDQYKQENQDANI